MCATLMTAVKRCKQPDLLGMYESLSEIIVTTNLRDLILVWMEVSVKRSGNCIDVNEYRCGALKSID